MIVARMAMGRSRKKPEEREQTEQDREEARNERIICVVSDLLFLSYCTMFIISK